MIDSRSLQKLIIENFSGYNFLDEEADAIGEHILRKSKESDNPIIQGGAVVIQNKGYLTVGPGTIDLMEAMLQLDYVEGVVSNGKGCLFDPVERKVYAIHTQEEVRNTFKSHRSGRRFKFVSEAKLSDLVIIQRTFGMVGIRKEDGSYDFDSEWEKIQERWKFTEECYLRGPFPYSKRLSRKFAAVASHVFLRDPRPGMLPKEYITSDYENILSAVNKFKPNFLIAYNKFIGMRPEYAVVFIQLADGFKNPYQEVAKQLGQSILNYIDH